MPSLKAALGRRKKGNKLTYDDPILVIMGSVQWISIEPTAADNLFLLNINYFFLMPGTGVICQVVSARIHICLFIICLFIISGTCTANKCLPFPLPASRRGAQGMGTPKFPLVLILLEMGPEISWFMLQPDQCQGCRRTLRGKGSISPRSKNKCSARFPCSATQPLGVTSQY